MMYTREDQLTVSSRRHPDELGEEVTWLHHRQGGSTSRFLVKTAPLQKFGAPAYDKTWRMELYQHRLRRGLLRRDSAHPLASKQP